MARFAATDGIFCVSSRIVRVVPPLHVHHDAGYGRRISLCRRGRPAWGRRGYTRQALCRARASHCPCSGPRLEQDFRLIDLQHRENLANREMALKAWNNLAAVPIEQIDAYYQAGIKPEEIADLLVKALGFTAITVGILAK